MQDPTTMTFSARAAAKDSQIEKIRTHEGNEVRLKAELANTEAQRAKDEEYLVQVALADAVANQALLEKYAHRLPPPPAPEPEVQPDAGNAATGTADPSTGTADPSTGVDGSATADAPAADPASPGADAGAIPVS